MEGLADKAYLRKILHMFPDDVVDVAGRHLTGQQVAGSVHMSAQIKAFFERFIVNRRIFMKIQHIGIGEKFRQPF